MAAMAAISPAQNLSTITGTVKSASGEPVSGAFVKATNAEKGFVFMAVTQAQGRYTSPQLVAGKYSIRVIAGDREGDATAEVAAGKSTTADVKLSTSRMIPPPRKRLLEADYQKMLPEGDAKKLLTTKCVLCHASDRVVTARLSRDEWLKIITNMRSYLQDMKMLRLRII